MGPEQKYLEHIHIDESKFREFLYSSDLETRENAIVALWGLVAQLGGLPPFISIEEFREFLESTELESKQLEITALGGLVTQLGGLPPFISTEELVELMIDTSLIVPKKGDFKPWLLESQMLELMQIYLSEVDDLDPLFACFKTRMKEDVEIHGGDMVLRICELYASERKTIVAKDIFAILNIALISQEVSEPNKLLALDIIGNLADQGVDVRRVKRILKKTADGERCGVTKRAQEVYMEAYSGGFNKPPNWFDRKWDQFRMWKHSKRRIVPPAPPLPVKKIKRTS